MHTKRIRMLFLIVCLGCLFLCSCGLDEYYYVFPPNCSIPHDIEQDSEMYWTFTCPQNSIQISMKGTAIYYKIYDDKTKTKTEKALIDGANNTEKTSDGFEKMKSIIDSDGSEESKYVPLTSSGLKEGIYINFPLSSWRISFDESLDTESEKVLVLESVDGTYQSENQVIYIKKPEKSGEYYINAYAVAVGNDISMAPSYSALAPLGVLKFTIE